MSLSGCYGLTFTVLSIMGLVLRCASQVLSSTGNQTGPVLWH